MKDYLKNLRVNNKSDFFLKLTSKLGYIYVDKWRSQFYLWTAKGH